MRTATVSIILFFLLLSCTRPVFKERWIKEKAPEQFAVVFETSKGNIEAEFKREWSPLAADRFYAQVKHHYYDHTLFYRVPPKFVAQFGGDDTVKTKLWNKVKVPDEPMIKGNDRGTIAFARSGKDSRDNDLFINLRNNNRLDTIQYSGVKGFPAFGNITKGMEAADSLYSGYGDKVFAKFDTLMSDKAAFLQLFPKLDSIKRIYLVRKKR